MYLLGIGVLMLLLKFFDINPVARMDWMEHWYVFAAPFILAVAWWAWADNTGYTKKKAMDKMQQRKNDRLERNREALGLGNKKRK
jgi:small Trp-rich protein